jgi:hypothetical protein
MQTHAHAHGHKPHHSRRSSCTRLLQGLGGGRMAAACGVARGVPVRTARFLQVVARNGTQRHGENNDSPTPPS